MGKGNKNRILQKLIQEHGSQKIIFGLILQEHRAVYTTALFFVYIPHNYHINTERVIIVKDLEYSIDYYHTLEGRRVALQILDFNFKDNIRKNVIPEIEYSTEKYSPFYIQQRVEYYKRLWETLMPYPVKVFCFDAWPYYIFCIYLDRKDN